MSSVGACDERALAFIIRYQEYGYLQLVQHGITSQHFDSEYRTIWEFISRMKREHSMIPSEDTIATRYQTLRLPKVKKRDLPIIVRDLRLRYKFTRFLTTSVDMAAKLSDGWDDIDNVLQFVIGEFSNLLGEGSQGNHLIPLFSEQTNKTIIEQIIARQTPENQGIPTGLPSLDHITGGLFPERMITIIGRTSQGKSWLDLFFVANAVINGYTVVLYPLEMSLFETSTRLYTIFSALLTQEPLRNFDLNRGMVTKKRLKRFLSHLESQYKGQLYVSDVGSIVDGYTVERIHSEVSSIKPAMFWVDYLSLLRLSGNRPADDWAAVKELSHGIKATAQDTRTVGGCSAQVNREAIRAQVFLPRLEHISYSDSIGQDSDHVISIAKRKNFLYYSLVKNRHGPEISKTKVEFDPDNGILKEVPKEDRSGVQQ